MKILDVPRSGSYQGVTSSRNRYGQYVRTRATPVNPASSFQDSVRSRLATNAAAWRALDSGQRAGWTSLGAMMSRTDSLGQVYTLNGFAAYVSVNNNLVAAGEAVVSDAPAIVTPDAPISATLTAPGGVLSLAYDPTPVAADTWLFVYATPPTSAGKQFQADYRLVAVVDPAAASPLNLSTSYDARFGTPPTGSRVSVLVSTMVAGFRSVGTPATVVVP